jgi:hypothetical protein
VIAGLAPVDAGRAAHEHRLVAELPAHLRDSGILVFLEANTHYVPAS